MSAAAASAADEADLIAGQKVVGCEMIQQMGILLRLPQVVLASAQVMFHRFYARRSVKKFDVRHFAMGALFLAAKVEEQPRKTRDVLLRKRGSDAMRKIKHAHGGMKHSAKLTRREGKRRTQNSKQRGKHLR